MPKLTDSRKLVLVPLTFTAEGAEAQVYNGLLLGDIDEIFGSTGEAIDKNKQTLTVLTRIIKSWNFEDDAGQPLPVTVENLKKVDMRDISVLMKAVNFTKDFLEQSAPLSGASSEQI